MIRKPLSDADAMIALRSLAVDVVNRYGGKGDGIEWDCRDDNGKYRRFEFDNGQRIYEWVSDETPVPGDSGVAKISRRIAELEGILSCLRAGMHPGRAMGAATEVIDAQLRELRFALEAITGVKP